MCIYFFFFSFVEHFINTTHSAAGKCADSLADGKLSSASVVLFIFILVAYLVCQKLPSHSCINLYFYEI